MCVWEWDIAGSCQRPVTREHFARRDRGNVRELTWDPSQPAPLRLIMHAKCRKCADCLRLRRREWTVRALSETQAAQRSWFGTLTCNPEATFRMTVLVRRRLMRGGTEMERLSATERYRELCHEISQELTRYLKRVRKHSGAPLRYLAVFEAHKSGFPHLHVLLHETTLASVRKKVLDAHWIHMGFTHWRLVEAGGNPRAALYVAKYIAKDGGRVRASIRYGKTTRPKAIAGRMSQRAASTNDPSPALRSRRSKSRYFEIGTKVNGVLDTADW